MAADTVATPRRSASPLLLPKPSETGSHRNDDGAGLSSGPVSYDASAVVRCYFLQTATRFVTPFVGWNM
jgi:hypothetical protein